MDCRHLSKPRTCMEPVAAGLLTRADGFGIVWPILVYGTTCPAFTSSKA
jgi:hypothetical protein